MGSRDLNVDTTMVEHIVRTWSSLCGNRVTELYGHFDSDGMFSFKDC